MKDIILKADEALKDVLILNEVKISICKDGAIISDADGYFVAEHEKQRTKELHTLMEKYHYGWYVAQSTSITDQLFDIISFESYILSHIGRKIEVE